MKPRMKTCKGSYSCGKEFPATTEFFHRSNSCAGGLKGMCKPCQKVYSKGAYDRASKTHKAQGLSTLGKPLTPTVPKHLITVSANSAAWKSYNEYTRNRVNEMR